MEFSRQYPGIKINILEKGSQRIMEEGGRAGALDLGCVSAPVAEDRFDHAPFVHDVFRLAVSSQHRLAGRSSVSISELRDEDFIVAGCDFSTYHTMRARVP